MSLLKHFMQNTPTVPTKWEWDAFSFSSGSRNGNGGKDGGTGTDPKYSGDANTEILSDDVALRRMQDLAAAKWDTTTNCGEDSGDQAAAADDGSVSVFSNASNTTSNVSRLSRRNRVSISDRRGSVGTAAGAGCGGGALQRSKSIDATAARAEARRSIISRNSSGGSRRTSRSPGPIRRSNTTNGTVGGGGGGATRRLRESKSLLDSTATGTTSLDDDDDESTEDEIVSVIIKQPQQQPQASTTTTAGGGGRRSFSPKRVSTSSMEQRMSSVRSRGMAPGGGGGPRTRSRSTSRSVASDDGLDRARSKSRDGGGGHRRPKQHQQLDRASSHSTTTKSKAASGAGSRARSRSKSRDASGGGPARSRSKSRDTAGGPVARQRSKSRSTRGSRTNGGGNISSHGPSNEGGAPIKKKGGGGSMRGSRTIGVSSSHGPDNKNNNKRANMRKTKSLASVSKSKSFDGHSSSISSASSSNNKIKRTSSMASRHRGSASGSGSEKQQRNNQKWDAEVSEGQHHHRTESTEDPSSASSMESQASKNKSNSNNNNNNNNNAASKKDNANTISSLLPSLKMNGDDDNDTCDGLDDSAADKEDAEALFIPRRTLVEKLHKKWGSRPLAPPPPPSCPPAATSVTKEPAASTKTTTKEDSSSSPNNDESAATAKDDTAPATAKGTFMPSSSLIEKLNQKWCSHPAAAVPGPTLIEKLNQKWGIQPGAATPAPAKEDDKLDSNTKVEKKGSRTLDADSNASDQKTEKMAPFVAPNPLLEKLNQKWGIQPHAKKDGGAHDEGRCVASADSDTDQNKTSKAQNDYVPPSPLNQVQSSKDEEATGPAAAKRRSKGKSPHEQGKPMRSSKSMDSVPKRAGSSSKLQRSSSRNVTTTSSSTNEEDVKQGTAALGSSQHRIKPTKKLPKRCQSEGSHKKPKRCSRSPKRNSSGDSTTRPRHEKPDSGAAVKRNEDGISASKTEESATAGAATNCPSSLMMTRKGSNPKVGGGGGIHLPQNPPRIKRSRTISEIQQSRRSDKSPMRRSRTAQSSDDVLDKKKKKPLSRANSHSSSLGGGSKPSRSRSSSVDNRKLLGETANEKDVKLDDSNGIKTTTSTITKKEAPPTTCNQTMSHAA